MKSFLQLLIGLPLAALLSTTALAQDAVPGDVDVNEITMDVTDNARNFRHANRGRMRNMVYEYMLENGDITQEELDARAAIRETHRAELKALREAGDADALAARVAELRQERAAHREAMREYVNAHEDLSAALEERRREMGEGRRRGRDENRGPGNGGGGNGS